jgi:hypothetical protein
MTMWPFGRHRPVLVYRRQGGAPPPEHETLSVGGDGRFDLWRTVGMSSPIGRFRGQVPAGDRAILEAAVGVCRRAGPLQLAVPPDAARETLIVAGATSSWSEDAAPSPPFADLATVARRLTRELTAFPEAAIAVCLGGTLTLAQLGNGEIDLDLSGASVRAVRSNGGPGATWEEPLRGPRSVHASAGWSYQLPFGHPFAPGDQLNAAVDNILAFDGEFWRSCSLGVPHGELRQ